MWSLAISHYWFLPIVVAISRYHLHVLAVVDLLLSPH
jgi:hypothetical protein